MPYPQEIFTQFIKKDKLDIKALASKHGIDFKDFCDIMYPEKVAAYAFYSTKSKVLASTSSPIQLSNVENIFFKKGTMSLLSNTLGTWSSLWNSTPAEKAIIEVELKDKNIPTLELIWIEINGQYKFIIIEFLKNIPYHD